MGFATLCRYLAPVLITGGVLSSCGTVDTRQPSDEGMHESPGRPGAPSNSALNASPVASDRIAALRRRFVVGRDSAMQPAIAVGGAVRFEPASSGGFAAKVPREAKRAVQRAAEVVLPARASGFALLSDEASGLTLRFSLQGVRDVPIAVGDGIALYAGALGAADVLQRVHAQGTEDYVVFEERPTREELVYDVDVSRVAGLRLVENTLEFLDAGGAPRLRVAPPYVIDANGARHDAALALDDCARDRSLQAPWGRPVTRPQAAHCTLRVSWSKVAYPAIVDPSWTATGSMTTARSLHTATVLASGKVLVASGWTAELYDEASGTFAVTGSMALSRIDHTATLLGSGKVLVTGGRQSGTTHAGAELYDPVTGTFAATGAMPEPRSRHSASLLGSGKVLIAGGRSGVNAQLASALLYDPVAGSFASTGSMAGPRESHTASVIASGKVLIAGGNPSSTTYSATAVLYDPVAGGFASTGSMPEARSGHTATVLGSGEVLIAGGLNPSYLSSAALYAPASGTFRATGSMTVGRRGHTATQLRSGKVLVAGGYNSGELASAELYNPASGGFQATASMSSARDNHAASLLPSGKVLVSGGSLSSGSLALAEVYDLRPAGAACTTGNDCVSGACDANCCVAACAASCKACAAGTGACVTVAGNDDPDTCTGANTCDAAGACKLKNGQSCSSGTVCASGFCVDGVCCNTGCGLACDACNLAGKAGTCSPAGAGNAGNPACGAYLCDGANGSCPSSCASDANCSAGYYCASDSICKPRKAQASACDTAPGRDCKVSGCRVCSSNNCIDGFCCNTACGAACDVCSAGLGAQANGTCGTAPTGIQTAQCSGVQACNGAATSCPSGCATDAECALTHYCSSNGTCLPRKAQAAICNNAAGQDCKVAGCRVCQTTHCVDGYCCGSACGPCGNCAVPTAGTCTPRPDNQPPVPAGVCGLYVCDGTLASCPNSCSTNADCIAGNYCVGGACISKLPQGSACSADGDCATGHCADGVCCDTACSGTCMACSAANKQSGTGNGVCGVARIGSNPGNQCVTDPVNPCGSVTSCKGTAAECAKAPPGTSCGPTQCVNGNVTGQVCDGQGACQQNATRSCGLFKCENNACTSPCAGHFACVSGNYCENGACIPQLDNGKACNATHQCKSGFCVDGVCCDAPCNGQCEACDVTGGLGQCKTVTGAPHGSRSACAGSGACRGRCDGTDPTVCSFSSSGTSCAPSSCAGDVTQPAGSCDNSGLCAVPATRNCLPYTCDSGSGACKTGCQSDLDCALGAKCDSVGGKCAIIGASCKDAHTVKLANGQEQSCEPYQCLGGACLDACTTTADCAPGYACQPPSCVPASDGGGSGGSSGAGGNGGSGAIAGAAGAGGEAGSGGRTDAGVPKSDAGPAAGATPSDSGGCGCRAGKSPGSFGALALALLATALRRRRFTGERLRRA
jgi:hypothetical protein